MKILSIIIIIFVLALIAGCQKAEVEETTTTMKDTTTTQVTTTTTLSADTDMGLDDVNLIQDDELEINLSELDY